MKNILFVGALLLIAFTFPMLGGGCESDRHTMIEANPGMTVVCQDCYDEAVKMRHSTSSRYGTSYEETHAVHQCPSCKTEMSTYVENGVTMIKCAGCAPNGVACDKCLPPVVYNSRGR